MSIYRGRREAAAGLLWQPQAKDERSGATRGGRQAASPIRKGETQGWGKRPPNPPPPKKKK